MRRFTTICLATALMLSACGDDAPADTTAASTTTAAPATTTTTAPATTTTSVSTAPTDGVIAFHNGIIAGGREFYFGPLSPDDAAALSSTLAAALGEPTRGDFGWRGFEVSIDDDETAFVGWETYEADASDTVAARLQIPCAETSDTCRDQIGLGSRVGEVIAAVESYRPEVGLDQWSWVTVDGDPPSIALRAGNPEFGFICFQATTAFAEPGSQQPGLEDWVIAFHAGNRCDAGVALDAP